MVHAHNIPLELQKLNQWVCWKAIPKNGRNKMDKEPINVRTGGKAQSNNPATWASYEEALKHYEAHKNNGIAGIGFVFTGNDEFCGLDIDDCRNPETGEFTDWGKNILTKINSYTEISPSQTGVKSWVRVRNGLPGAGINLPAYPFELYDRGRFFTVTGQWVSEYSGHIEDRSEFVLKLYKEVRGNSSSSISANGKGWQDKLITGVPENHRHRTALRLAARWGQLGLSDAEIANSIVAWNFNNRPPKPTLADPKSKEISDIVQWVRGKSSERDGNNSKFPSSVMTGTAGNFATLFAAHLEVPKEFFFMSFLTALGSIISGRVTLASELAPQPRLFTLLMGESADDRKSTALNKTTKFFNDNMLDGFRVCYGVNSAEGLQRVLDTSKNVLITFDEFKQFVSKCKIDTSVLLPCVNTLFESNHYESQTKKHEVLLNNAHLSLLAASTVGTYERIWDPSFIDIGFYNRLFLVPGSGERKFSFPTKIPQEDKAKIAKDLAAILGFASQHPELDLSQEAKEAYHGWYMTMEKSVHSKRLDTYALRLMILLAVNKTESRVTEENVRDVISLCDWQYEVRQMYDPINADTKMAAMEEKIRRVLNRGPVKDRELKQRVNANRAGVWIYSTALNNLVKAKEIQWNSGTWKKR